MYKYVGFEHTRAGFERMTKSDMMKFILSSATMPKKGENQSATEESKCFARNVEPKICRTGLAACNTEMTGGKIDNFKLYFTSYIKNHWH